MDIATVKKAKLDAENEILSAVSLALNSFYNKTGMSPSSVDVTMTSITTIGDNREQYNFISTIGDNRRQYTLGGVDLTVEL